MIRTLLLRDVDVDREVSIHELQLVTEAVARAIDHVLDVAAHAPNRRHLLPLPEELRHLDL